MRILLLSRNRVVQELVKLGVTAEEGIELEIAAEPAEVSADRYDLLLLDDRLLESSQDPTQELIVARRVLLGETGEASLPEGFDAVLSKPFLPADIRRLFRRDDSALSSVQEKKHRGKEALRTEVLDAEEILKIRQLLGEPEMETPKAATEKPLVEKEDRGEGYTFEELLALLEKHKVKKLRKLLKGAVIRLSIEFPEAE